MFKNALLLSLMTFATTAFAQPSISQSEIDAINVISCYRSLIYDTAHFQSKAVTIGRFDIIFGAYRSNEWRSMPTVRKDAVDALVNFLDRLNQTPPGFDFKTELKTCEQLAPQLKATTTDDNSFLIFAPDYLNVVQNGIYNLFPKDPIYQRLSDKQKTFLSELLYKSSTCRGITAKFFAGAMISAGVALSGFSCHGQGGQTWFSVAPTLYGGLGVGLAGGGGAQVLNIENGWAETADVRYAGVAGGAYWAGGYAEGNADGTNGGGLVIGKGLYTMFGGELMLNLPWGRGNDATLILDMLSSSSPSTSSKPN